MQRQQEGIFTGVDARNVGIASLGLVIYSHCWVGAAMRVEFSHDNVWSWKERFKGR